MSIFQIDLILNVLYNSNMKISYKCDYALKVLLELALKHGAGVVTSKDISEKLDIPLKFLEQILSDLRKGNYIESRRGNQGGYLLIGKPSQMRIGDIVRYIDGPTSPIDCIDDHYCNCREVHTCVFRRVWKQVDQAVNAVIDQVTLDDMVRDYYKALDTLHYSI